MIKKALAAGLVLTLATSCVSSKVYKDLEDRYAQVKKERNDLRDENDALSSAKEKLESDLANLQQQYDEAVAARDKYQRDYDAAKKNLENLQASYNALEKNSSAAIAANSKKNRELLAQLEAKQEALKAENARLAQLQRELDARSKRVNELEGALAAKEAAMKKLKDAISKALLDFEGKGLTVEQRDGKVYVSMENKLLFESGSWYVGAEGRKAVMQLGKVLAQNPDIAVLIEGHTDDDPYKGSDQLTGNWDLSAKRATAIVNILMENPNIKPNNLTAAGRSEYEPVSTNETKEGKARNRRIEVILTPKLDEVTKILNQI
ncbi:OmpA family protein [Sungkyunkwania multivorans]|uniref:OmpA family protein n=1 Tax=Sungkyunkwania multivorans TaxID=1173618 RepID=A0ABW3D2T9_9FLAO